MPATIAPRPFAVVIGAASGAGYQLARCCAEHGYDLLVAADTPGIEEAAQALRDLGGAVDSVLADPCSLRGVEQIHRALAGRAIDALLIHACAGRGWGQAGGSADPQALVEMHINGTLALLHRLGAEIRSQGCGRILVTGTISGFVPAFVESFSLGPRSRLHEGGARITCVIPGAAQAGLFSRTDGLNTRVIHAEQDDPTAVATLAFHAMLQDEGHDEGGDARQVLAALAATPQPGAAVPAALLAHTLRGASDLESLSAATRR
jgi:short-subunit dehydrogenase